jgi:hypothetical protein
LSVAVLLAYALVAPASLLVVRAAGPEVVRRMVAAAVAAGLCWAGALAALVLQWLFRGTRYALVGTLGAMLPRLGIPLACGVLLQILSSALAESGLLVYLVAFYPVTLAVETALTLPGGGSPAA